MPTVSPMATPTPPVGKGKARIYLVLEDGATGTAGCPWVAAAHHNRMVPNGWSMGLKMRSGGVRIVVGLSLGLHRARAQRVTNPFSGVLATGYADIGVLLVTTVAV